MFGRSNGVVPIVLLYRNLSLSVQIATRARQGACGGRCVGGALDLFIACRAGVHYSTNAAAFPIVVVIAKFKKCVAVWLFS